MKRPGLLSPWALFTPQAPHVSPAIDAAISHYVNSVVEHGKQSVQAKIYRDELKAAIQRDHLALQTSFGAREERLREILTQIAKLLGDEAFGDHDFTFSEPVLPKLPELVEKTVKERDELRLTVSKLERTVLGRCDAQMPAAPPPDLDRVALENFLREVPQGTRTTMKWVAQFDYSSGQVASSRRNVVFLPSWSGIEFASTELLPEGEIARVTLYGNDLIVGVRNFEPPLMITRTAFPLGYPIICL